MCSRSAFVGVTFLAAAVSLADGPVPSVYQVDARTADGRTVRTEAVVYHFEAEIVGTLPSGGTIAALVGGWTRLVVAGGMYELTWDPWDGDPFRPRWTWRVRDAHFGWWPPRVKDPEACAAGVERLELRSLPDAVPDCSMSPKERAAREAELKAVDDAYADDLCHPAYERNYRPCPAFFPGIPPRRREWSRGAVAELPGVIADWTVRDALLASCEAGDEAACSRVFSRYERINPGHATSCFLEIAGRRGFRWADEDETECAFHAYLEALQDGCRPPACTAAYRFEATRTWADTEALQHWPDAGLTPAPFPPDLRHHARLLDGTTR